MAKLEVVYFISEDKWDDAGLVTNAMHSNPLKLKS